MQENKERCRTQQTKNTRITNTSLVDKTNSVNCVQSSSELLRLMSVQLPQHWQVFSTEHDVQYSKFQPNESGVLEIQYTLIVHTDLTWNVLCKGNPVPASCRVIPQASTPANFSMVTQLLHAIDGATMCPGNLDDDFVQICQKRGGTMKGSRGNGETVAIMNGDGSRHPFTVRHIDCEMVYIREAQAQCCNICQQYCSTLRVCRSRLNSASSDETKTAASSHAKYTRLTPIEKDKRLKNLQQSLQRTKQQVKRLEEKVKRIVERDDVQLSQEDADDFSAVVREVNQSVEDTFPGHSPQRIFWDQQKQYHQLKDKRQMRWHSLVLRFSLNLKYMSTSAYRAVRQSGIISVPSERTLSDYTHWTKAHSGIQFEFVEELKSRLEKEVTSSHYHCTIVVDEMKIKSGLIFDKHSGRLTGFVDLGDVNRDMEQLLNQEQEESSPKLADQVLVFMARAVFKPSLAVPVAHYFSLNLSGKYGNLTVHMYTHMHAITEYFSMLFGLLGIG